MRYKDWIGPLYIFGEYTADKFVDVAYNQDDIVTHISRDQAEKLIAGVKQYTDAIDWLLDRVSEEVREQFLDKLCETNTPFHTK